METIVDNKTPLVEETGSSSPPVRPTLPSKSTSDMYEYEVEEPKVPLQKKPLALLKSFFVHIVPTGGSAALFALLFSEVYWFDNYTSASRSVFNTGSVNVSQNDILNSFQFVAKVYEMFLLSSLSTMVLYTVRLALLGKNGLPFALLSTGYGIDSIGNIFSKRGWASLSGKGHFTVFTVAMLFCTIWANVVGPFSAIVLIPKLAWYKMPNPFGPADIPVITPLTNDQLWPLRISSDDFVPRCFDSRALLLSGTCPVSGFYNLMEWTSASALQGVPPVVSFSDGVSGVRREVKSSSAKGTNGLMVAMATSLTETMTSTIGSFWRLAALKHFPVTDTARPKLRFPHSRPTYQPLVQVECGTYLGGSGRLPRSLAPGFKYPDINNFSPDDTTWILPEWVFEEGWSPTGQGNNTSDHGVTKLRWVNLPTTDETAPSLAAIVYTPATLPANLNDDKSKLVQWTTVSMCAIDARWIASKPVYDPAQDATVKHNISKPLDFKKTSRKYDHEAIMNDKLKWGVSDQISIDSKWAESLDIDVTFGQSTLSAYQWLLGRYVRSVRSDRGTYTYHFAPAFKANDNSTQQMSYEGLRTGNHTEYQTQVGNLVATTLSLSLADGLARTAMTPYLSNATLITGETDSGKTTLIPLADFGLSTDGFNGVNRTADWVNDHDKNEFSFVVHRYGYGWTLRDKSAKVAISILFFHAAAAVVFMFYTSYDFMWGRGHISSAWGDLTELAALLINSNPSSQLQNTCAGIEKRDTWKKVLRVREIGDGHLGVLVGSEGKVLPRARVGWTYGSIPKPDETKSSGDA